MFRRLPARASVLASVVLSLALTSACTDGTLPSSLGDASAVDASDDTAFRRGSPGKGPSWKSVATSVEITPGEFVLNVAAEADLSATVRNRTGHTLESTVTWTSTDPTVASVAGGSVKALKAGNALIIASVNDLADTATARVTTERVEIDSLIVSPASASVIVGQKLTLTVQTIDTAGSALAGRTVTWASSDAAVATVTAAGVLSGIAPGRASVTATSEGSSASVDVSVSPVPAIPVATVAVSPSPAAVAEDATLQLAAATADADGEVLTGRTVTWKSSNESVAKVSSTGLLTGTGAGTATITATSEGQTGTTTAQVAASTIAVAAVSVSPSTGSVAAGASLQLVATPKDAGGRTLTGRSIAWSSSNTAAATVSASGLVKGVAGGSASIHATVEGKSGSAAITVTSAPADPAPDPTPDPTPEPTDRVGYYVAPSGSSAGTGTKASPWDLSSVLRGSMPVRAGDTVWVRGGRYRGDFISYLNGSSGRLIVVRAYPGERATIDGHLAISGSYTAFWGLEVMMSSPNRAGGTDKNGVNVRAPGSKLINMVVHDIDHVGIGTWKEAPDSEIYGTIVYNVGYQGDSRGHGHSLYIQNLSGLKRVRDNIMYNSFSYGVQAWTSPGQYLRNIAFEGNVVFNSGMLASGSARPDLMVGGADAAAGISLRNNYTFRNDGGMTANLSYGGTVHRDLTYVSNYLVGTVTLDPSKWTSISQSGNAVMANSISGSSRVIVRPNAYERGRANIIVYNWGGQGMVSADLSGVLSAGDSYEVRNVQDFFGTPVASGTFSGGSISIPIRAVAPPTVLGGSGKAPPSTGTKFQVFVVVKR